MTTQVTTREFLAQDGGDVSGELPGLPERYSVLRTIGMGGMGAVLLVSASQSFAGTAQGANTVLTDQISHK